MIPMKVMIKETGKQESLQLMMNGTNCVVDVIGNHDGLGAEDHQFQYDEETGNYIATQGTFDWWEKVVSDEQDLEDRIEQLKEEHGSGVVYDIVASAEYNDLEDHAGVVNAALDEAFEGN